MEKIIFENGEEFVLVGARGEVRTVGGARRDVITATVQGTYAEVLAQAGIGQGWSIWQETTVYLPDETTEQAVETFDKGDYTLLVSVKDNLDGTIAFEIAKSDTLEQVQAQTIADQNATITAQNAELDELTIMLLEGADDDAI